MWKIKCDFGSSEIKCCVKIDIKNKPKKKREKY